MTVFSDTNGNPVPYDGQAPITWRLTVYALVEWDGKVLMMRPRDIERWELPGGEVQPEETLLEGLRREVFEETGYTFTPTQAIPIHFTEQFFFERDLGQYRHAVIAIFAGTVEADRAPDWSHAEPGEVRQVAWVSPAILTPSNTHPNQWPALTKSGWVTSN